MERFGSLKVRADIQRIMLALVLQGSLAFIK
jgi:hypothetical protein